MSSVTQAAPTLAATYPNMDISLFDDGCPFQVTGLLDATDPSSGFLFHYRFGEASLSLSSDRREASIDHGDSLDSSLAEPEFAALFVVLMSQMPSPQHHTD